MPSHLPSSGLGLLAGRSVRCWCTAEEGGRSLFPVNASNFKPIFQIYSISPHSQLTLLESQLLTSYSFRFTSEDS